MRRAISGRVPVPKKFYLFTGKLKLLPLIIELVSSILTFIYCIGCIIRITLLKTKLSLNPTLLCVVVNGGEVKYQVFSISLM